MRLSTFLEYPMNSSAVRATHLGSTVRDATESAFVEAPIGMALVDMAGQTLRVNDAFCRITGYTAAQTRGRPFRELSGAHAADVDSSQKLDLLAGRVQKYDVETRYQHALGHSVEVLVSVSLVRDDEGQPLNLITQVQDISERKTLEARLEHLVSHDHLTGLFNARHFEEALAQETRSAARYGHGGAVLLLDLDHFKQVNDRYGHLCGDTVLMHVGKCMHEVLRSSDLKSRYGGEEFLAVLPSTSLHGAGCVAETLRRELESKPVPWGNEVLTVTASIGVTQAEPGELDIEAIIARADAALYRAKQQGRNCVRIEPDNPPPPPVEARRAEIDALIEDD